VAAPQAQRCEELLVGGVRAAVARGPLDPVHGHLRPPRLPVAPRGVRPPQDGAGRARPPVRLEAPPTQLAAVQPGALRERWGFKTLGLIGCLFLLFCLLDCMINTVSVKKIYIFEWINEFIEFFKLSNIREYIVFSWLDNQWLAMKKSKQSMITNPQCVIIHTSDPSSSGGRTKVVWQREGCWFKPRAPPTSYKCRGVPEQDAA